MEMTNVMTPATGLPAVAMRGVRLLPALLPTEANVGGTRVRVDALSTTWTRHHAAANADVPAVSSYFQTIKSVKPAPPPRGTPH
jgi:hypothetical protein